MFFFKISIMYKGALYNIYSIELCFFAIYNFAYKCIFFMDRISNELKGYFLPTVVVFFCRRGLFCLIHLRKFLKGKNSLQRSFRPLKQIVLLQTMKYNMLFQVRQCYCHFFFLFSPFKKVQQLADFILKISIKEN